MSATSKTVEIGPGERVTFADGEALHLGIVNGAPWVLWDGSQVSVIVPVHDRERDWNGLVAAANIRSVGR